MTHTVWTACSLHHSQQKCDTTYDARWLILSLKKCSMRQDNILMNQRMIQSMTHKAWTAHSLHHGQQKYVTNYDAYWRWRKRKEGAERRRKTQKKRGNTQRGTERPSRNRLEIQNWFHIHMNVELFPGSNYISFTQQELAFMHLPIHSFIHAPTHSDKHI